jgi:hypothetical protein
MMAKKKIVDAPIVPGPNAEWEYVTELKIQGERGRFRFVKLVRNGDLEWIDVWGGLKKSESMRSFRLDRVKRVHYKNQTVGNLAQEYKEKKALLKAEKEEE